MPIYDSIGQSYTKFRLPDPRIVDSLVNLLQLQKGSSIAEIGAGTGNYSRAIADRGYFLYQKIIEAENPRVSTGG